MLYSANTTNGTTILSARLIRRTPWPARVQAAIDVLDGKDAVKDFTAAQVAVLFDVSQAAISKHRTRRRPRKTLADRFRLASPEAKAAAVREIGVETIWNGLIDPALQHESAR